jgi:hypothetical protein
VIVESVEIRPPRQRQGFAHFFEGFLALPITGLLHSGQMVTPFTWRLASRLQTEQLGMSPLFLHSLEAYEGLKIALESNVG